MVDDFGFIDYSAAKLEGAVIRAAGYRGAVRYIDDITNPSLVRTKHTNRAEYQSHIAAGLDVLLVMEVNTSDPDGGYGRGRDYARRALAGARAIGYPDRPIFFCNDRTTLPDATAWKQYLDGAASVLGPHRVGAYGFKAAVLEAIGHAEYFWQAGRRSELQKHVHLWQDNNVQVRVGGVTCDRNHVQKPITPITTQEDDMDAHEHQLLVDIHEALFTKRQPSRIPGDQNTTVLNDAIMDTVARVSMNEGRLNAANAKLDGLAAAVAALASDPDLDLAAVKQIVQDAVKQNLQITGTVQIGASE